MSSRSDISQVPLQGGYIAKLCPVVIQNRILEAPEVVVEAPDAVMRMKQGIEFERSLTETVGTDTGWVVIPDLYADQAIPLTLTAMDSATPVIGGGWLPHDEEGRRTGKPDLLVFAGDGYVAVDIKHRKTVDEAEEASMLVSGLADLTPGSAFEMADRKLRTNSNDALQLAHYRRMLESSGYASGSSLAGIIGKELVVAWYDLDAPMWTTRSTSDPTRKTKRRSSMDVYDFEFGFRLDIAAAALAHRASGDEELLVEPMWRGDCRSCGYHDHCMKTMGEGTGDASLIPNSQYPQWRQLRDAGIRTRGDVAALHYPTAALAREADVEFFIEAGAQHPGSTPVSELRPRASKQLAALESAGIRTVADLAGLDPATARLGGFIAQQILDARAALGPDPVYLRPESEGDPIPRADIEIDIDMESMNEGVYLWGVLVTDRVESGLFEKGYRAFTTWGDLDNGGEQKPFLEMLDWLDAQRSLAGANGLTLKAYVWYETAENTQLTRIARTVDVGTVARVREMIDSEMWVDLKKVFDRGWMTGGSTSLKAIAPLAGFAWPVDDPGGGLAMVRYIEAVTSDSEEARQWILDYNRGDVEATRAIRDWLDREGARWQRVSTA